MSTTTLRPSTRDEWLALRKSGIGSSEVATIVGLNPFDTPLQLWRRKTGRDLPEPENQAMKRGHWCEDAVAQYWADTTGHQVIKRSVGDWIIRDNDRPYLQVSPDRTYWVDGDGLKHGKNAEANKGILECKTTNLAVDADNIPKHWFCQVQYQLAVSGYTYGSIAWMQRGFEFGHINLQLVPDFAAWLIESVERFWNDNVLADREPEPINVEDVLLLYNRHTEGVEKEATPEVIEDITAIKDYAQQIKTLEEAKKQHEERVKMYMEDAGILTSAGETIATWKAAKDSLRFDSASFKADHADLYNQYCKPQAGSRRFVVK